MQVDGNYYQLSNALKCDVGKNKFLFSVNVEVSYNVIMFLHYNIKNVVLSSTFYQYQP
jgi:hypothetical protein